MNARVYDVIAQVTPLEMKSGEVQKLNRTFCRNAKSQIEIFRNVKQPTFASADGSSRKLNFDDNAFPVQIFQGIRMLNNIKWIRK